MIEVAEALRLVLSQPFERRIESRHVGDAVGYSLAEDIRSDVDSPPHDKALVDGYAIRMSDVEKELRVLEQIVAGTVPTHALEPGTTSEVMTGAPIPDGTEAMVMVERAERTGDTVRLEQNGPAEPGQHIMRRGKTFSKDQVVLSAETVIRPIEVGLLCEVGRAEVRCFARPEVAVLPTGDELVSATQLPTAGQIRNSNGPMLAARTGTTGADVHLLGVGRDNEPELRSLVEQGLQSDILILSGGVSAGVRDLVPSVLESLGVEEVFHKVRLKPGKPLWFGVRRSEGQTTAVFGLPGNPVSSLVCFELFVQPLINKLSGVLPDVEQIPIRLAENFRQRGDRPTYWPAESYREGGRLFAKPLPWKGSADMLTVCQADCLIHFPAGDREFTVGEKLVAISLGS